MTDRILNYYLNHSLAFESELTYYHFENRLSKNEMDGVAKMAQLVFDYFLVNVCYFDFWRKKEHNFAFSVLFDRLSLPLQV